MILLDISSPLIHHNELQNFIVVLVLPIYRRVRFLLLNLRNYY